MIYECQVTVRDMRYIRLVYKQSVKFNKPYNVFMRVSEKLEFYAAQNCAPLGYIDMDGLKIKGVKVWDEDKIKKQAKLQSKVNRKSSSKKDKSQKKINKKQSKRIRKSELQSQSKPIQPQQSVESKEQDQNLDDKSFDNTYNFVVYKDGYKDSDDIIILDIHTQSRALKTTLQKITVYSNKKTSNPLSFQPNKTFNTSLMSSENPQQRYRGFLNLAMILLVVLNLRNIVANLQKYGIQQWPTLNMPYHTYLFLTLGIGIHIIIAYILVRLQFKKSISNTISTIVNTFNIISLLVSNLVYANYLNPGVFASNLLTMMASVVTLKLISYIHFNSNIIRIVDLMRVDPHNPKVLEIDEFIKGEIKNNMDNIVDIVTIQRLAYFILAPTLCYQLEYPRNTYIRKGWLAKRIAQYLLSTLVMNIVVVQYVLPELATIREYYVQPDFKISEFAYLILELSVPVMIFWVIMFYSFFHALLNIIGELTKFGDRSFYLDWWNCKDHDQYWRKWNLPVHNWMLRHLYIPLTEVGLSKQSAGFTVFFVSGLYHEYWIGVPLQILSFWAFLAIMIQAPLISFQKFMQKKLRIRNSEMGNVVFWISFCFVGQPLVVFAYYYLYTTKN